MEPVGTHGLACIGDEDFAAFALYMQCLAEDIDAALTIQRNAFTAFRQRPTIILTNTSGTTIAADPVTSRNVFDTVVFNNSTFMSMQLDSSMTPDLRRYIAIGSAVGAAVPTPYPRGMYQMGIYTSMAPTGAVSAFSYRQTLAILTDTSAPIGSQAISLEGDHDLTFQTPAAITSQVIKTSFVLNGEIGVQASSTSSHGNGGSTVTINPGGFWWVTYVGPTDIVEVT